MPTVTRRRLLTVLGASVVVACTDHSSRTPTVSILPPFDTLSTPALIALATAVNRVTPDAALATHDLLDVVPIAQRRAVLDERSRADARVGSTVDVDGWVLPTHLAGLAGMYHR